MCYCGTHFSHYFIPYQRLCTILKTNHSAPLHVIIRTRKLFQVMSEFEEAGSFWGLKWLIKAIEIPHLVVKEGCCLYCCTRCKEYSLFFLYFVLSAWIHPKDWLNLQNTPRNRCVFQMGLFLARAPCGRTVHRVAWQVRREKLREEKLSNYLDDGPVLLFFWVSYHRDYLQNHTKPDPSHWRNFIISDIFYFWKCWS